MKLWRNIRIGGYVYVDDFRFMGYDRMQLTHAINYHDQHHPHAALAADRETPA